MPQDLITLKKVASELNSTLIGAKVNKILQPSAFEIDLALYQKKVFRLVINTNAKLSRVSISFLEKENPLTAPNFCMLLRKHLTGAEVTGVSIANDDRIIKISFSNLNDFKESVSLDLFAEIMGKYSNLFLVKNGKILGSLRSLPQGLDSKRLTLVGTAYTFPDKGDKISILSPLAKEKFLSFNGTSISKFITTNFYDFAPVTASEIEYRLGGNLDGLTAYKTALSLIDEQTFPVTINDGNRADFYFTDYLSLSGERKAFKSIVSAMESVYSSSEKSSEINAKKSALLSVLNGQVKKLKKRAETLSERISSSLDASEIKLYGELITQYIYLIKKGQKSVTLTNYTENGESKVTVLLDETLTPQQNAQKYFKAYRKKKSTYDNSIAMLEDVKSELNYLSSIAFSLENAETPADFNDAREELIKLGLIKETQSKRKKQDRPSPFNEYLIDGFSVLVGKNNVQNDRLLSLAERGDLWFHVKSYHSSHLIIKTDGKTPAENVIKTCAEICAYHSEVKGGDKVEVDYTYKKFVKKQGGKNLGAVYYTDQKTIVVTPNQNLNYKK